LKRILVVGGYGGFGGRLSQRLAVAGHQVLVGGRSYGKAKAYCASRPACEPVVIDRTDNPAVVIAAHRPDLVIDAAGPFQGSDYTLPRACISAGVDYLDLADARDFVAGIGTLDTEARSAGVAVIAGASSVPALSQAVITELAQGLDRLTAIETIISASSRASAGASVASAIIGGVGRKLRLWSGGRWTQACGWQSLRRERVALPSGKSIGYRWVALADVPDLALVPERFPGVSSVSFRAGAEPALATIGLWAASLLVTGGLLRSLLPFRRPLVALHRFTSIWGGDRSGMVVRLFGTIGGRRVERRWSLIAEKGDGPEIPTLAAAILAGRTLSPGARDAGGLLCIADFAESFAALAVEHASVEIEQQQPLYRRVMGEAFDRLTTAVQSIHGVLRDSGAAGEATVERGSGWLANIIATVMRFPPSGDYPVHVHFEEREGVEQWSRDFGGHRFSSRLSAGAPGQIVESFGLLRFHFSLPERKGGLAMILERWSIGPLPMPLVLGPRVAAREWQEGEAFHFDVDVALPAVGPIIRYRGWLNP
jgi:hypothetical protein